MAKYSGRSKGHTNYLSPTIEEEILSNMAHRVLEEIMQRIKKSKYYSISLDSTPDEGDVNN